MSQTLRIAIDINITPGVTGGVAQSTQGLVASLGRLDGPEEYLLITDTPAQSEWISASKGPNQRVVMMPRPRWGTRRPAGSYTEGSRLKRALRPTVDALRQFVGRLTPQPQWPELPISDGFVESLGCNVVHYPTQWFTLCALPTIYNPHDLQHVHYPQFFTPAELASRDVIYRRACQLSNTVVVGSEWIKRDVVDQYSINPAKVQIIPWAPPTAHYPSIAETDLEDARRRLHLPETYVLYPAVTWPHKNHIRLFEALARLRDEHGLVVRLVCTGARYESHWPVIQQRLQELSLTSQVTFLGFLSERDLRCVYRLAQLLILPSLFEADSCPIHEAWSEGIPVASSSLSALPDQVGDAGLLFDATDVSAIANTLKRMVEDESLRRKLIADGYRRVADFDWDRTARAYRAVYRRAAGVTLSDEDRWLLAWDWMKEPSKRPMTNSAT